MNKLWGHGKATRFGRISGKSEDTGSAEKASRKGKEMNEEPNEEMNDLNVYGFLEDAEEILGEVAHFFEKEGKDGLPLARRVRRTHEQLRGWQERVSTKRAWNRQAGSG